MKKIQPHKGKITVWPFPIIRDVLRFYTKMQQMMTP